MHVGLSVSFHWQPSTHFVAPPMPPQLPQRTLEELFIKGPIANTRDNPEFHQVRWHSGGVGGGQWAVGAQDLLFAMVACYLVPACHCRWHAPIFTTCTISPGPHPPKLRRSTSQESLEEQQDVLHAWHSWVLRELDLFKSKFRGAAATLLGAGDCRGFSVGELRWRVTMRGVLLEELATAVGKQEARKG